MERLTHKARYEAGYKLNKGVKEWQAADRLGAYENTGLTPPEITGKMEALRIYKEQGLTPDRIAELKERDTAKAPIKDTDSGVRYTDDYICPNCGKHFIGTGIAAFCYHCGQRLKWEE